MEMSMACYMWHGSSIDHADQWVGTKNVSDYKYHFSWWQPRPMQLAIFTYDLKIFGVKFFQPIMDFASDFFPSEHRFL